VDANKLKVLKSIGYEVRLTCANCVHSFFPSERSDWGTCSKNQYQHEKHTGDARDLSIHKSGRCAVEGPDGYTPSPTAIGMLGRFAELLED
jgi:hypothetical protein